MPRSPLCSLAILAAAAVPLAAQQAPTLERLAFLSGCWTAPAATSSGWGTIEERFTTPSANLILGTTRYLVDGRSVNYEFSVLRADSAGIALTPYLRGERSRAYRLTRMLTDTAFFEAAEPIYPRRIIYARAPDGALVLHVDSGGTDPDPLIYRMVPAVCHPGLTPPAAVAAALPQDPDANPRGGNTHLLVFETFHGLWLGLAVPAMTGAEGAQSYGLGLLFGPVAGFALTKAITDNYPVTIGQSRAIVWSGQFAAYQTAGWLAVSNASLTTQQFFGATAAGLAGGTLVGTIIARRPISGGDASLVAHASSWGVWFGLATALLLDFSEGGRAALIGGDIGLLAGALSTRTVEMSSSRVWVITAMGITGGAAGLGVSLITQPDDDRITIAAPAILSAAGLLAGTMLTWNYDAPRAARATIDPPSDALLAVRNGRARLGVPALRPALVPRDDVSGRRYVPGVEVTLFSLRH